MKKLFIVIFTFISFISDAQISIDWKRPYSPPSGNIQTSYDIAADAGGNSYITGITSRGYNGSDLFIAKYNSLGSLRWSRSYDGGNEGAVDEGRSLSLSSSGSNVFIYIGANISVTSYGNQACVIKYDSAGNMLWSKSFASGYNSSFSKVVNDVTGNVYACGGASAAGYVFKLNTDGDSLWYRSITLPAGYTNISVKDIVVDNSGIVYGTGHAQSSLTNYDMFSFRLNSNGSVAWIKIYHNNIINDGGIAVALSSSGNLYATGYSDAVNGLPDIILLKYNLTTGDTLFVKRFNGTLNDADRPEDMAVDNTGNIFITGSCDGSSGDMVTLKYSDSGILQWSRKYSGAPSLSDAGRRIIPDDAGNVFAGGRIDHGFSAMFILIKYNSSGDSIWTRKIETSASNGFEEFHSMTLDASKNILMTGECDNDNAPVVKYDSSGVMKWSRKFFGSQLYADFANSLITDKNGNVYAAGKSRYSQFGDQYIVMKYNRGGDLVWVQDYGIQLYDNYDAANAITMDTSGFIYAAGDTYSRFNGNKDYLVVKLDTNGNQLWAVTFDSQNGGDDHATSIAADNAGNVYVTGQGRGPGIINSDYFTVKLNSAGVVVWEKYYNASGGDYAYDIAVDNSGNVIVTGQSYGGAGGDDIATVKYNSSGTQLWTRRFNGTANGFDYGNNVEVDRGGNVYVAGTTNTTGSGNNSILIKYGSDISGTLRWSRQDSHHPGNVSEFATDMKLDSIGTRIYIAGTFISPDNGRRGNFLVKYDSTGYRIKRNEPDYVTIFDKYSTGLCIDRFNNVYTGVQVIPVNPLSRPFLSVNVHDSSLTDKYGYPVNLSLTSSGYDIRNMIAVNHYSEIFIGGGSYDSTESTLMSVTKLDQSPFVLNLRVVIQGFYNSSANTMIPDTVRAYIRERISPYAIIDSSVSVVNSQGYAGFMFDSQNLIEGALYYVEVRHRNSINTWSYISSSFVSGELAFDFTTSAGKAYGSNQFQADTAPVTYAIYNGDADRNGQINLTDMISTYNNSAAFINGYVKTDMTGDNQTNLSDLLIVYNNSSLFISTIGP